jgi:hypothetical protein
VSWNFVGKSLPRTEDARLLRGLGRYTADLAPLDACRLYVVRSPHAAALLRGMDTRAAAACPGVRLILTANDPEVARTGAFTSRVRRQAPDGAPNFEPPYRTLSDRGAFVGDAVAAIVADTLEQAKDAAEALDPDWAPLPAVTGVREAVAPGAPQVWDAVPGNTCFVFDLGAAAEVEQAIRAGGAHRHHRLPHQPGDRGADGDAGGAGQPRRGRGQLHPRRPIAEPALHPRGIRRARPRHPWQSAARGLTRCRRRLRAERIALPGVRPRPHRGASRRRSRVVGGRAQRKLPRRPPRPRHARGP